VGRVHLAAGCSTEEERKRTRADPVRSLVLAGLLGAWVVSMVALAPSQRDAARRH
jgi:hypothetical protein